MPTLGDWFRAGGYRTFYKGKWHASHAHLDADDGDGLPAVDRRRRRRRSRTTSRGTWRPTCSTSTASRSGSAPSRTDSASTTPARSRTRSPPTRRSRCSSASTRTTSDEPWLTVCSFLNPHDDSLFGVIALTQGLRYHPSTGAACRSGADARRGPLDEAVLPAELRRQLGHDHRAAAVERDPPEVLLPDAGRGRPADHACPRRAARRASAYENTIVIFTSDHGDMQGAHGGMHEKWHVAYEEALHVPFIVSSPLLPGGARELDIPTNHADLIPTLLGLAGIDPDQALARLQADHTRRPPARRARPLAAIRAAEPAAPSEPILFTTDDEISEGSAPPASPFGRVARRLHRYSTDQAAQPPADRHRRGRRRRRAAPGQVLPLLRQRAVLDRPRRARRAPPRRARRSPSPSPNPTSTRRCARTLLPPSGVR